MDCVVLDKFCQVFTGFDGMPINVRVQQDANEFFSLLIDILQRELKESSSPTEKPNEKQDEKVPFKDPLNEEYGGIIVNRIQSMEEEYPYQKDRTEAFLTVPLTIKDIESMKDALDKFCSEEYFVDDNKLHIEEHDRKIGVSKKSLFQKLPPTLIFNLKRFEYNTTTWQRYKLNSFFDFPEEIDLRPWCVEDLDKESDPKKY